MSELNLTPGQAIDLMFEGKIIEDTGGNQYHLKDNEFRLRGNYACLFLPNENLRYREYVEPKAVKDSSIDLTREQAIEECRKLIKKMHQLSNEHEIDFVAAIRLEGKVVQNTIRGDTITLMGLCELLKGKIMHDVKY
jgi:hypothetical protein